VLGKVEIGYLKARYQLVKGTEIACPQTCLRCLYEEGPKRTEGSNSSEEALPPTQPYTITKDNLPAVPEELVGCGDDPEKAKAL
jgi:hypothetical protein